MAVRENDNHPLSHDRYDWGDRSGQVGAVLVFKPGVSIEQAQYLLGLHLGDVLEGSPEVKEFNPEHGYPVFYVP